jgi:hypothetical protein
MTKNNYLIRCLKRVFIFQSLFLAAYYKTKIIRRGSRFFYKQLSNLLDAINIDFYILRYLGDKEDIFQGFLIILITFAGLGITGFSLFEIIAGLLFILYGFIYHSPLPLIEEYFEGSRRSKSKKLLDFLPSYEFALCFTVGMGMICDAFNTPILEDMKNEDIKKQDKKIQEKNNEHPIKNKKQKKD